MRGQREMAEADGTSSLGGLVGAGADALYARLRATGPLRWSDLDGVADAATELLDRGVAVRVGGELRSVDPVVALRLVLEARQREVLDEQRRVFAGWSRLHAMMTSRLDDGGNTPGDGLPMLTRPEEVAARAAELYAGAKRRVRVVDNGILDHSPVARHDEVVRQVLCQAEHAVRGGGASLAQRWTAVGDEVRLRDRLPMTMVHVDDSTALATVDRTAATAMIIRTPALLDVLTGWFDLLWRHPATVGFPVGRPGGPLNGLQQDVLTLMLGGGGDEAIARRLGLSVSTVRRTIRSVYDLLGVNNRFAVGVAAAKQNWI